MTPNYLGYQGRDPEKLYKPISRFCAGIILLLNAGYGGTGALHHLHTTPCDHLGGLLAPARPFTDVAADTTASSIIVTILE